MTLQVLFIANRKQFPIESNFFYFEYFSCAFDPFFIIRKRANEGEFLFWIFKFYITIRWNA